MTSLSSPFAGLPLDVAQRLSFIANVLDEQKVPVEAPILDIGGHPGLLARHLPHRKIYTADTFAHGPARYIRGSGGNLPFKDNAFAAAVCSDTLEHVPAAYRSAFLMEMVRVSDRIVVVSGPFDTRDVATAEKTALGLLPAMSPSAGWLREHAEYGLPDLEAIAGLLASYGRIEITGDGDLLTWLISFALLAEGERRADVRHAAEKVLAALSNAYIEPAAGPFYRHGIVLDKSKASAGPTGQRLSVLSGPSATEQDRRSELLHAVLALVPYMIQCKEDSGAAIEHAARSAYLDSAAKAIPATDLPAVSDQDMFIAMGQNDLDYLSRGWHALTEGPGGVQARWTAGNAGVLVPSRFLGKAGISVIVMTSAPPQVDGKPAGLSLLTADDIRLAHVPHVGTEGQWRMVHLNPAGQGLPSEIFLTLESLPSNNPDAPAEPLTWVADKIFSNGDFRTMGALIASIRFTFQ
jgi:hypothetical protein